MNRFFISLTIALLLTAASCKKDHPAPPPPPPSSAKDITAFELKKTDNPTTLTIDLAGAISNDTIRIAIPAQAPTTSLIPYITISGTAISPASGVPQNFGTPVNYTVTAADGSKKTYVVIVTHRAVVYVTTSDGVLSAIDPATGMVNWKYQSTTSALSTPTAGDALAFFTGADALYAVNAITGAQTWKMPLTAVNEPFSLVLPGPAYPVPTFLNGVLYGSFSDGTVRAIDATTGTVKWTFTTSYPFISGPTVYNGALYVGSVDGYIYSLDAGSGAVNWKFRGSGDPFTENPLLYNNMLYIGSQGANFYALQASSGQLVWSLPDYFENCSPTSSNGSIYIAVYNDLYALDPLTGTLQWYATHNNTTTQWNGLPSPYYADSKLFVGSLDGNLYANDATTGKQLWSYNLGAEIYASPVVVNGKVYLGATSGNFVILNATTGTLITNKAIGPFPSSACLIDSTGTVYHAAESGEQN